MHFALLGATGGVGSQFVDLALAEGHRLTVLARTPSKVARAAELEVVEGDAFDVEAVRRVVRDADVVVSALGSTRGPDRETSLRRMAAVLAEGLSPSDKRVIWCGSEGMDGEIPGIVGWGIQKMLAKPLADHSAAVAALRDAQLTVTVARPRTLNDGGLDVTYTEVVDGPAQGAWSISRASVAHFLLKAAVDATYAGKSVAITTAK